jgi:asparagine synthase (glutamine-hydrolysing)
MSESKIEEAGYFKGPAVAKLMEKAQREGRISEVEEMALVGILSTQLLHSIFIQSPSLPKDGELEPMKIVAMDPVHDA